MLCKIAIIFGVSQRDIEVFSCESHLGSHHRRSVEGVSRTTTLSSPKKLVCSGCTVKKFHFRDVLSDIGACIARATLRAVFTAGAERAIYDETRPDEIFLANDRRE